MNTKNTYTINNYQTKKTFSSFLSAIAGKMGVPIWSFYVNRGQLITSFGTRDKNGSIIEFFPANGAYINTNKYGFRTFIKIDGKVYEFFGEAKDSQTMSIRRDQVSISEINVDLKLKVKITYYTLPNEDEGALVRKVEIFNLGDKRVIEVIDGLPQILPAGIDYGGYKAVSNLLQSWMEASNHNNVMFYKLRASTGDSSEVSAVNDGNYYYTTANNLDINYIYDYKRVFGYDTSLTKPVNFENETLTEILKETQVSVNQVPAAFSAIKHNLDKSLSFISLVGYASDISSLKIISKNFNYNYLLEKEEENRLIHEELVDKIQTETAFPIYDEYVKQNFMDNVLRGGIPLVFETKDGIRGYHIYSRKHGDLERDYNFFSIEPKFYSQGNGNFRDVLQNRRNDLYFVPEIVDSNLIQFASLIQADGYNPLSIEGMKFKYQGNFKYSNEINNILKDEFTPGDLATQLKKENLNVEENLNLIIKESKPIIKATFGEGYWEDHFTYLDDIIDSIESIYPDKIDDIVFNNQNYLIYNSGVYVKPRIEKHVLTKDLKVRQYEAIKHNDKTSDWLTNKNNEVIKTNLIGKLLTLIVNKYAHLDPLGIGLSYEANKPGWNDAMNGLPGLFASGVSETVELLKNVRRVKKYLLEFNNKKVYLLNSTNNFIKTITKIKQEDDFKTWDLRMTLLEEYRLELENNNHELIETSFNEYNDFINKVETDLEKAVSKAKELNEIIPTYLTYEVTDYEKLNKFNERGEELVKVKSFKLKPIASFLEAPARYIKTTNNKEDVKKLYKAVKDSELYDNKFKFYKTSVDLTNETHEIGRIHAFTKGWLERESNFLHMTYKYILGLLSAGLYDEFYEEIKTNYICFMDPEVYGRSPLENSTFIAPSNNPDKTKHGQGFVARLTGSTAEFLSMWHKMFFGNKLFSYVNNELVFTIAPKLNKMFFKDSRVKTTLFSNIEVEIINKDNINTYDLDAVIEKIVLFDKELGEKTFDGAIVTGNWVQKIRQKSIYKISVYIKKEEK